MAELVTEYEFKGNIAKVYQAIRNYKLYPQYLPGVTDVVVGPSRVPNSSCQVRYDINLIKTFYYTLNMFEKEPDHIWWTMAESNLMKQSNGSWRLSTSKEGWTKAIYTLDITFKGLVPSMIVDQVTKANLPSLMRGFQKMIDEMPA